jgi:hypothetical protein
MRSPKNIRFFVSILIILVLAVPVNCNALRVEKNCNGRVAVLVDSSWDYSHGWSETDYVGIVRELTSALEYLGYGYDLVDEKTPQQELERYAILMAVTGSQGERILSYGKGTGRPVVVFYSLGAELAAALDILPGDLVLDKEEERPLELKKESPLTAGLMSHHSAIPWWGAYEHRFGKEAEVLLSTPNGLPVLVEQRGTAGHYIFF